MLNILVGVIIGLPIGAVFHAWFARQAGGAVKQATAAVQAEAKKL